MCLLTTPHLIQAPAKQNPILSSIKNFSAPIHLKARRLFSLFYFRSIRFFSVGVIFFPAYTKPLLPCAIMLPSGAKYIRFVLTNSYWPSGRLSGQDHHQMPPCFCAMHRSGCSDALWYSPFSGQARQTPVQEVRGTRTRDRPDFRQHGATRGSMGNDFSRCSRAAGPLCRNAHR